MAAKSISIFDNCTVYSDASLPCPNHKSLLAHPLTMIVAASQIAAVINHRQLWKLRSEHLDVEASFDPIQGLIQHLTSVRRNERAGPTCPACPIFTNC